MSADTLILFAHGARDPRCPPQNTEAMAKALEKAGNKPEHVIIQSGEMHGFYDVKNRVNLYTTMLGFFDRHIGRKGDVAVGAHRGTQAFVEGLAVGPVEVHHRRREQQLHLRRCHRRGRGEGACVHGVSLMAAGEGAETLLTM